LWYSAGTRISIVRCVNSIEPSRNSACTNRTCHHTS
jgi:hypothetical protein